MPTLRLLSGGGAPKPPEIFFEVKREMGIPVAHGYGMTEVPMITQGSPNDTDDQLAYTEGAPVRGTKLRIVGADGEDCRAGTEGEVRIGGPVVCHGYTDPELNAAAFDEQGYFRTGDLGVLRPDGHVTLTGRLKDVIIRKGENISAKEIEDLLYEHPRVANVAVIGLARPGARRAGLRRGRERAGPGPADLRGDVGLPARAGLMMQKIPEQLEHRRRDAPQRDAEDPQARAARPLQGLSRQDPISWTSPRASGGVQLVNSMAAAPPSPSTMATTAPQIP